MKSTRKLDALKWAWESASDTDRKTFLAWLRGEIRSRRKSEAISKSLTAKDGRLTLQAVKRIETAMRANELSRGQVMEQMGYARNNTRLGFAMARTPGWKPRPAFLEALAKWLARVESV